jgi:hypothetical protein
MFIDQVYGPPRQYFYALGGAPYLGRRPPLNTRTDLTVEDIFAPDGLPVTRESLKISMEEQTHWARAFGPHSLAYENSAELDGQASVDAAPAPGTATCSTSRRTASTRSAPASRRWPAGSCRPSWTARR